MFDIDCGTGCREGNGGGTGSERRVTLVFHREELLYDIRNYAWIEGHVWGVEGEESRHARHTLEEIGEAGNVDRVNRILETVHAVVVEMLYPYTKEDTGEDEVLCDRLHAPRDYVVEMRVPGSMSRTTLRLLVELIHEFMVARVVYDWLSITHPEAARNWLEKALEAQEKIGRIKNNRRGALRRRMHPF